MIVLCIDGERLHLSLKLGKTSNSSHTCNSQNFGLSMLQAHAWTGKLYRQAVLGFPICFSMHNIFLLSVDP